MQYLVSVLVFTGLLAAQPALSKSECGGDARSLYQLGEKAYEDGRDQDAIRFYTQAAEECNSYEYWMTASEVWVEDVLAGTSATNIRENGQGAVAALSGAYASAENDAQRIAAAKGMIQVGLMSDDPINARTWLVHAKDLGAKESELGDLRRRIEAEERNLTANQVSRGSGKGGALLFDPIELASAPGGLKPSELGAEGGGSQPPVKKGPQKFSIPINFASNSTVPNEQTVNNVDVLADALVADYPNATFRFVGHADQRGDADYNMQLSMERAAAVQAAVEKRQPNLAGRIEVDGQGELQPRESGTSEAAYRSNRRLEVFISE